MKELTETEKNLLALSLQSMCMKYGPTIFEIACSIVTKLEIGDHFVKYNKDWIDYAKRRKEENQQ